MITPSLLNAFWAPLATDGCGSVKTVNPFPGSQLWTGPGGPFISEAIRSAFMVPITALKVEQNFPHIGLFDLSVPNRTGPRPEAPVVYRLASEDKDAPGKGRPHLRLVKPSSEMTDALYEGSVLDQAIEALLENELKEESIDAGRMHRMAVRLTQAVRTHLPALSAALSPEDRSTLARIAQDNGIDKRIATIEYLANLCLFRAIRDYHELPETSEFHKEDGGSFVVLTQNGSIVSSPPLEAKDHKRSFHYMRLPSRKIRLSQTESRRGHLVANIRIGQKFQSTCLDTSPVTTILCIPPEKASLFRRIREWTETSVSVVHTSSRFD